MFLVLLSGLAAASAAAFGKLAFGDALTTYFAAHHPVSGPTTRYATRSLSQRTQVAPPPPSCSLVVRLAVASWPVGGGRCVHAHIVRTWNNCCHVSFI